MYRKIIYEKYLSSSHYNQEQLEQQFRIGISLHKKIIKALPIHNDARIIDMGCGSGAFLKALKQRGYKNLYGVEISDEQNEFLNSKGFQVYQQDIIDFIRKQHERFDLITFFDVLEHFNKNELVEIISSLVPILSDTGKIIIRVPNGEAIFKGSIMYGDITHETFFTKRSINQLFKTFNFKTIDVYPVYNNSQKLKSLIKFQFYKAYIEFYKMLLSVDNSTSLKSFIPTQNIIAIISKQ